MQLNLPLPKEAEYTVSAPLACDGCRSRSEVAEPDIAAGLDAAIKNGLRRPGALPLKRMTASWCGSFLDPTDTRS